MFVLLQQSPLDEVIQNEFIAQSLLHDPCRLSGQLPLLLRGGVLVPHVEVCHLMHLPGPGEVVRQQALQDGQGFLHSVENNLMMT